MLLVVLYAIFILVSLYMYETFLIYFPKYVIVAQLLFCFVAMSVFCVTFINFCLRGCLFGIGSV
jgi:hypothetical protein